MMMNEVCSSSFEGIMREKIDSNIDVSSHYARIFVTFSIEDVVVRIWHSWLNGNLDSLLSFLHSFPLAAFALIFLRHDDTKLVALLAWSLDLSKHSRSQLRQLHSDSRSFAIGTSLGIRSSFSFAVGTHSESGDFHFLHFSAVNLLKGHIYLYKLGLCFLRALVLLLIEKFGEASHAARRSSIFDSFLSILIIELPLFGIQKCVICIFQPLKLVRISSFIRMFLQCFLSERLLDLFSIGILGDLKQFIKLGRIDLLILVLFSLLTLVIMLVLPLFLISVHPGEKHCNNLILSILFSTFFQILHEN